MSSKFSKYRKPSLIAGILVLAAVHALQIFLAGRSSVRNLEVDGEILSVEISGPESSLVLEKKDGKWFAGKYEVAEHHADDIVDAVKSVRILGTVSKSSSDNERFGFSENNAITVRAKNGDKILRELIVGKEAGTGVQCYVKHDGKNAVCLAQKNLRTTFSKNLETIREKTVYEIDGESIAAVKVQCPEGNFAFSKNAASSGEGQSPASWNLDENTTGAELELDGSKVASWIETLASLRASSWLEDDAEVPEERIASARIDSASQSVSLDFYTSPKEDEVIVRSSSTPYLAAVSRAVYQKYAKNLADLGK